MSDQPTDPTEMAASGAEPTSSPRRPRFRAFSLAIMAGLALFIAGYLGGVAATSLWPAQAQTSTYRAQLWLEPWPSSTLSARTVLGDVRVNFGGPIPAPSIAVEPQVKAELTDVFAREGVSVESLRPSDAELRAAVRSALVGLAWRFAAGAFVTVAALVALVRWGRRGSTTGLVQVGAIAAVLVLVVPTVAAWQTYRASNVGAIRTTSLLGMVRSNAGMLSDVQARSQQVSRYVVNALALTQALERTLRPPEGTTPAVRLLLVSDIHGANQYPLIKSLVQEEGINAVVDTGDLINFGRVQEAEASGIFTSIADLGVPYIFVRGNHDATSANDDALLQRLARIPNVVLLEPSRGKYQELDIGGLRIGGFNDPRWYGDADSGDQGPQTARQKEYVSAYADRPLPDIVLSHEPQAVNDISGDSRLLLNGHVHTPGLNGRRVTIGTLTGGGIFGRRLTEGAEGGTEKLTSTYYFDVAQFGTSCGLISLTRYAFKDIVEGRPAYQDLSVLNGQSIVAPPTGRTCTPGATPRRVPVG